MLSKAVVLWWHMPITPAFGSLVQEELEFEVSPDYMDNSRPASAK